MSICSSQKAAGCSISRKDIPNVGASLTVYCACFGRGMCIAVLAASIPSMAVALKVEPTAFGEIFTFRGVGFLVGTVVAAGLVDTFKWKVPKHYLVCGSILLVGISTMQLVFSSSFLVINILSFLQGVGFGGVHTFSTLSLMEMWGTKAQVFYLFFRLKYFVSQPLLPFLDIIYCSLGCK
jgi:MFS family permease